jgi:hypothetical protein
MLTVADEKKLKGIVNGSTIDDTMKQLLVKVIDALAVMAPASAAQVVGLADDTFAASGSETITIKDGVITAIA